MHLKIISLHGAPWELEIGPNETIKQLKILVSNHYVEKGLQVKEENTRLRLKRTAREAGIELDKDDEPVKDTMEEGSAVFFKFRSVGQEPAVAGTELPQRTQQEPPAQTDAGPSSRDEARNLTSWTPEGSPEITVHVVRPRHEGRKNREPWEPQHVESLLKGIERHGLGTWSKILTDSQLSFPESANQVTLKDKWRNLSKTISSGAKARGINVTEELRRRVLGIQMAYGEH
mmetsp:Transcript_25962/g.72696  ORF Transcript_25962/g.72696 Transcript_25962/m.72696 type:complete len:231 (+) Transcript_25962:428-1120(+)|eukprot:CAMPEP_0117657596 /NCGR_PEP_ID=MMETSP0804-20121206/5416_1 /TAXON_ID=1074897 /ORGANISM="Tetraselmis astigmatica, Strain CCMP880" /LENGTH=230 /DNA_ID=CAMNT_0005464063 /DNA_START=385 /DNA_END=1077 /DNA_ORIENTATION=+